MEELEILHKKVKKEAIKALVLNQFLGSAVLFLLLHFVLSFFGFKYYVSLAPAIIYFLRQCYKKIKQFRLEDVEEHFPELKYLIEEAEKSIIRTHKMTATALERIAYKAEIIFLIHMVRSQNVKEKIYAIAVLSILIAVFNTANLYPPKIVLSLEEFELTRPTLQNIYESIEIIPPNFTTIDEELEFYKNSFKITLLALNATNHTLFEFKEENAMLKENLSTTKASLNQCTADLTITKKNEEGYRASFEEYKENYEAEKARADTLQRDRDELFQEKIALLEEKNQLLKRINDLESK